MYTCTKKFADFPFAHRQPSHDGHCALIHGHNWSFKFIFGCKALEAGTTFVVDFGKLQEVKAWLASQFDHTLVLNGDDPWLEYLKLTLGINRTPSPAGFPSHPQDALAKIIVVPSCSSEGLASYVYEEVNRILFRLTEGRAYVMRVEVEEDGKNSAAYAPHAYCHHE